MLSDTPLNNKSPSKAVRTWLTALEYIAGEISPVPFQTWLTGTTGAFDGDTFTVVCPNLFTVEVLSDKYADVIRAAVIRATGNDGVKITFRTPK